MKKIVISTLVLGVIGVLIGYILVKNNHNEPLTKVVVFLKNNVTDIEINETIKSIKLLDNVENVSFESKDEIKEEIINSNDRLKEILNYVDNNPLLDTITLFINSKQNVELIVKNIEKMDTVESVRYYIN